jgi:hypothetical protein
LLRHAENVCAQHLEPACETGRLGIDEAGREHLRTLRGALRKPREPEIELVEDQDLARHVELEAHTRSKPFEGFHCAVLPKTLLEE